MNPDHYAAFIKTEAARLGFEHAGISKAAFLEEEAPLLEQWLSKNHHGTMSYMERWFDKRLDPRLLVDGAKTVVSLLYNYFPSEQQQADAPKISKYAYGEDYHFVIRDKLKELLNGIREQAGDINGRAFVDSAPVLERAWAKKSGLGWTGKNANLIHPRKGSFFFLAELIIDLEATPDMPMRDYCGSCTRCMDACPTQAIVAPGEVDGSKCISYFTIELKAAIPDRYTPLADNWMFGCDVCQDVCPWNRFSKPHRDTRLEIKNEIKAWSLSDWKEVTEEVFEKIFKDSPLSRPGFEGIKRNLNAILPYGETPA